MKEVNSYVLPDVQTSLAKEASPNNDSSEKAEESVPEHVALERRSKKKVDECVPVHVAHERINKKKVDHVVNIDELTSDEEPLANIVTRGIAKRMQRRKGNAMVFNDSPSKEMKGKSGGLKSNPSKRSIGKSHVGPTRSCNKVITPTRNRKDVSSSDYEFDIKKDVQDITLNAERWKYVIQKRVAMERESAKDSLKCKKVAELIEAVGLMKTVTKFGPCYEILVKEFMVTIPDGCDDVISVNYRKVYVKGNVVTFSLAVINKFLGRKEEPQAELEVTDDQVCKEITAKQVPTNQTSTISTGLGNFIYDIGTKRAFDFGKYIFEQVLKQAFSTVVKMPICFPSLIYGIILKQYPGILLPIDSVKKRDSPLSIHYKLFAGTHVPDIVMTSSKKKEAEHGGDDNEGTDVQDYAGGDDAETDEEKEVEGEEYATADSDSQEDI
ncbi:uncharacterized protein LOC127080572 [Lathyrus oleraceus]|uniref:uncharacterized protein LOC127080572 n=1 Tax=Pisum sativum TaxID=3888 RepID=UPI0021D22C5A|nr:uncharacterized protein LOC127080572 [Pisum sativum]